jgi:hypothetical protein
MGDLSMKLLTSAIVVALTLATSCATGLQVGDPVNQYYCDLKYQLDGEAVSSNVWSRYIESIDIENNTMKFNVVKYISDANDGANLSIMRIRRIEITAYYINESDCTLSKKVRKVTTGATSAVTLPYQSCCFNLDAQLRWEE